MKMMTSKTLMRNMIIIGMVTLALTLIIVASIISVNSNKTKVPVTNENINNNEVTTPVSSTAITFVMPLKDAEIIKDYSAKELQYNDTLEQWEIHRAVDFKSETSNEVYAVWSGTVSNVYSNYLEGTVIVIDHGDGLKTIYKSMDSSVSVAVGDVVKQGSVIGLVSDTMSKEVNSGNHLHFEVFLNEVAVDPNDYFSSSVK